MDDYVLRELQQVTAAELARYPDVIGAMVDFVPREEVDDVDDGC